MKAYSKSCFLGNSFGILEDKRELRKNTLQEAKLNNFADEEIFK